MSTDTPRTDSLADDIARRHGEEGMDDFNHYFQAAGEFANFARQLERELSQCGPKGGWTDGDFLDQALTNATGSILSQYAADVIRKRAIELRLSATGSEGSK